MSGKGSCEACSDRRVRKLHEVRLQGRKLRLCGAHAQWVTEHPDGTLAQLSAQSGGELERRKLEDRRSEPNRRLFPPRPESRRYNGGRRVNDPVY